MKKLADFDEETQDFIMNAAFQHYNPWRIVLKEDSISTPVRIVVDPTMTSFNLLLAKGENLLRYIFDIIVRNRCKQNAWSSDISKLYNQLNLDISALSYSLFLFHDSLDPNVEPEVWVMTRAWYGISSTGGQAGAGIINLITMDQKIKMLYKPWKKIDLLGEMKQEKELRNKSKELLISLVREDSALSSLYTV